MCVRHDPRPLQQDHPNLPPLLALPPPAALLTMIQIVALDYGFITRLVFSRKLQSDCNCACCSQLLSMRKLGNPARSSNTPSPPLAGVTYKNIYIEFENVSLIRADIFFCLLRLCKCLYECLEVCVSAIVCGSECVCECVEVCVSVCEYIHVCIMLMLGVMLPLRFVLRLLRVSVRDIRHSTNA